MAKKKAAKVKSHPILKKLWNVALIATILGLIFSCLVFIFISFSKLPDTEELENPNYDYASIIYADDGQTEIGRWFSTNREWTDFSDLNTHLVDALIATEDLRFYKHSGIDVRGTLRAFAYLGSRGGASTITQQLAKLFFTTTSSNFVKRVFQKLREWVIATQFERRYTKEEIIAMFLNKMDFRYDSVGIGSAAKTYFGKDQKNLKLEEAALLVGMLKNPRLYNPVLKAENATKRREVVLKQMQKAGMISQTEYDEARVLPLDMSKFRRSDHKTGLAPYFRNEMTAKVKKILSDPKYADASGKKYNVYRDGLKVYSTINVDMQRHAEESMTKHMRQLQDRYFQVWRGRDVWTHSDKNQKALRTGQLNRMIEESERYKSLRNHYLTRITSKISGDIKSVRLWNSDIKRILNAKESDNYLAKLVRQKTISRSQKAVYEEILSSTHFPELVNQWNKLQRASKSAFTKKVKMKVFDHSSAGDKSVVMSPLDSVKFHGQHLHLGSVAIEPGSGRVKTWVGGIGYEYFQYDHINTSRQVGSTFKPFIYATAMMDGGNSPCLKVVDKQYCIEKNDPFFDVANRWCPKNSNNTYTGESFTLFDGMRLSKNTVSAYLMKLIGGVQPVIRLVEKLGIPSDKIPPYPSIALGTPELSVMEMTSAYTVFANNGDYIEPTFIDRIEDKDGKLIYSANPERYKALPEKYSYAMVEMLKYASPAFLKNSLNTEFGGKTGTTDDHTDGWFMGIMPNLVVGTWVGGNSPWVRFNSIGDGAGGKMARPFYIEFMKRVENDKNIRHDQQARFQVPAGDLIVTDCSLYESLYQKPVSAPEEEFDEEFDEEF